MFYVCLILLYSVTIQSKADCPPNILTRSNELFVISNQSIIYIEADVECQLLGGSVARISDEDRDYFYPTLNQILLKGLAEVEIYYNPTSSLSYDPHKYRADGYSIDTSSLADFEGPGIRDLSSIWLSSSSQSEDTNKVQFCYIPARDLVMRECIISEGWIFNFELYEETNQSDNTIMLYNYYANPYGSTSKFSLNKITGSYWSNDYSAGISFIYLKDISLFIGARSDVNQNKWYWSNNTEVNNPMFSESNSSLCQQMTWPLTYNDGINLRPKQCETGMSHYVCSVYFSINVNEVVCNATSLNISWNSLSQLFQDSSNVVGDFEITIQTVSITRNFEINFNQSHVILDGLNQRTEYHINVSLQIKDCPTFQLTASSSGRTDYGVPDPVTSAYVNNTYNQCKIIWKHTNKEVDHYQIIIQGNLDNDVYLYVYNAQDKDENETLFYDVNLSMFTSNQTLDFKILATSSCDLQSLISKVEGNCNTPHLPSTSAATTPSQSSFNSSLSFEAGIGVGIGICIGVMIILVVILKLLRNFLKQKSTKDFVKEPVYETALNETHEYSTVIEKKKVVNQITGKKTNENEGVEHEIVSNHQHEYENVRSS